MKTLILILLILLSGCAIRMAVLIETDEAAVGSNFKFENQNHNQKNNLGVGV